MYIRRCRYLEKNVLCLVDTGRELTLEHKDMIYQFCDISLSPSIRQVWAANNTPIRINDRSDSRSFSMTVAYGRMHYYLRM